MTSPRFALIRWSAAFAAAAAACTADAAILRVGPATDPACDFVEIQAALDAAQVNGEDDSVHVSIGAYRDQALRIAGHGTQFLGLSGGYESCASDSNDDAYTTLDGAGGLARSVLTVTDSSHVDIGSFEITGGDATAHEEGGGITVLSTGTFTLANLDVHHNTGAHGGGMRVTPSTGTALVIGRNLAIRDNRSQGDGGGIHALDTDLRLRELVLTHNVAGKCGGGAYVAGGHEGQRASLLSGEISHNRAVLGGGLCADAGAQLRLYNATALDLTRVAFNDAADVGGGVLVRNVELPGVPATRVRAHDSWFDHNRARRGAAVAIETPAAQGAGFFCSEAHDLLADACHVVHLPPEHAGCPLDAPCGYFTGNVASADGALPAGASLVHARGGEATFDIVGFHALDNGGATLIDADTLRFGLLPSRLSAGVVARNRATDGLFRMGTEPAFMLTGATVADNDILDGAVIEAPDGQRIYDSIIWQPGTPVRAGLVLGADALHYLLVHDAASLGPGIGLLSGVDPAFVTRTGERAYRLSASSPAVDFSESRENAGTQRGSLLAVDAVGTPRDRDDPDVPGAAVRDLGAYERVEIDPLFVDGFE